MLLSILTLSASRLANAAVSIPIINSKHNLSTSGTGSIKSGAVGLGGTSEVCVFCHTPHGASQDSANGINTLLWNRVSSPPTGYTYKAYTSATMTNSMSTGKPTGVSMMCMSCHDGVTSIAVNTLLNGPGSGNPTIEVDPFSGINTRGAIGSQGGFGSNPINIGDAIYGASGSPGSIVDMSNDHPISFDWPTGKAGLQATPTNIALRLFGAGKRVECATCHLVHDNAIPPFLAMSNVSSNMCKACHIK